MWMSVIHPKHWQMFFEVEMEERMLWNLSADLGREEKENWPLSFGFSGSSVWMNRNELVFERKNEPTLMIFFKMRTEAMSQANTCKTDFIMN